MRRFMKSILTAAKWVFGTLALLIALGVGSVYFGFSDEVDGGYSFDPMDIPADLDAYLAVQEAGVLDLRPEEHKRIIWAGDVGQQTDLAIVYLHGYSASSEEIRPVPDQVADTLGANLFYTRFAGHAREGAAMAEPRGEDWLNDTAEAMEIGRRIGKRVIVLSTSTGGTLATAAAADPDMAKGLAGIVMVAPNFRIANPMATILTWPGVRWWGPKVAGEMREFEPENALHAKYWTTRYPTVATVTLGHMVRYVSKVTYENLTQPALFIFSDQDQVVDPEATRAVIGRWGGPVETEVMPIRDGVDAYGHVLVGDIKSPANTEWAVGRIVAWISSL